MSVIVEDKTPVGRWEPRGGVSSRYGLYGTSSEPPQVTIPVPAWFRLLERVGEARSALRASNFQSESIDLEIKRITRFLSEAQQNAWIDVTGVVVPAGLFDNLEAAVASAPETLAIVRGKVAGNQDEADRKAHDRYIQTVVKFTGKADMPSVPRGLMSSRQALRRAVEKELAKSGDLPDIASDLPVSAPTKTELVPNELPASAPISETRPLDTSPDKSGSKFPWLLAAGLAAALVIRKL